MSRKITIAIDGYSSCGKSTMAKYLARQLGYIYIDTGAMYRAVTLYALQNGMFNGEEVDEATLCAALDKIYINFADNGHTMLNGVDVEGQIRSLEVSNRVYKVSSIAAVRERMVDLQRKMGDGGGVVMDGRDIGTVVFPNAELKVFVTASAETRAKRRYDEMLAKGEDADYEAVLDNVRRRDYADEHREVSPLRKAEDAELLDNSNMTIEGQNSYLLELYKKHAGI